MESSSVQRCTRDIHRDLERGDTDTLQEWIQQGKSPLYFVKRALSYPYKVRYRIANTLCRELTCETIMRHPGFYSLGHRTLYDWTYMEMIQRCKQDISFNDPDELWALKIMALHRISNWGVQKEFLWKQLLRYFDGSPRWVRCFAAFLCTASEWTDSQFNRTSMVRGWNCWMNPSRTFHLMYRIYPLYCQTTIQNAMMIETSGEMLMMGLVWVCKNTEDTREDYVTPPEPELSDSSHLTETECAIEGSIGMLFSGDPMSILRPQPLWI